MPESLKKILDKFNNLESVHKMLVIAGITLFLSAIILLIAFSNSKNYATLYYNMPASQAGEIIAYLKKHRIPYKVNEKNGLIEVPKNEIYEVRMILAKAGIPSKNGVGWEIFDKTKLGETEFVQHINYIRAIQGELARSIETIRGIKSARVHIVIPKESLFVEDQAPATASIIITYELGYRKLTKEQVKGIVNLVANSVEGLKPDNIKIIDNFGNVLTDILKEDQEDITGEVSKKLTYKKKIEKYYEKRIQSMLEKVVGKGKVIARVAVDIDFTKSEKTIEAFDPDTIAERSHQKVIESTKEYNPRKGGIPGVVSNVPSVKAQQQKNLQNQNLQKDKSKTQEIVNYEVSKTVSKIVDPVGVIKRISVAVLVDGQYKEVKKGKKEIKEFVPRSKSEMKIFTDIVKKAIGFNPKRNDQVEVSCVQFNYNELNEISAQIAKEKRTELIMLAAKYGLTILALLIIFFFVFRPFLKVILQRVKPPEELLKKAPRTLEEIEKEVKAKKKEITTKEEGGVKKSVKDPKEILIELIDQNPQEVAKHVQKWIRSK